jgi:hypothetical protein
VGIVDYRCFNIFNVKVFKSRYVIEVGKQKMISGGLVNLFLLFKRGKITYKVLLYLLLKTIQVFLGSKDIGMP